MKAAITSNGNTYDSLVDSRFGRCAYFVVYDTDSGAVEFIPNPNKDKTEGVAAASAQLVTSRGVKKVISGEFGAKVKGYFDSLAIQLIILKESKTIQEVIDLLKH